MPNSDLAKLKAAIQHAWPNMPSTKAQRYVGKFFDNTRTTTKIIAKVMGNHGTYTVSLEAKEKELTSACGCYIGKGGYCHHCEALAITFLQDPISFKEIKPKKREEVQNTSDVRQYLQGMTLEALLKQLSEKGITQKAFAESIGMNRRHLSTIKSSEARHHYFNELGATKLACLWALEHLPKPKGE